MGVPMSPFRKLMPYALEAKRKGIEVIHLNIGQPDIKTPEAVLDAVKIHSLDILAYTRSEGSEEYRLKIAAYYAANGIQVSADDIIVTTGGSEALLFAFGCTMDAGDEINTFRHAMADHGLGLRRQNFGTNLNRPWNKKSDVIWLSV